MRRVAARGRTPDEAHHDLPATALGLLTLVVGQLGKRVPGYPAGGERERSLLVQRERRGRPRARVGERAAVEIHPGREATRAAAEQRVEERVAGEPLDRRDHGFRPLRHRDDCLTWRSGRPCAIGVSSAHARSRLQIDHGNHLREVRGCRSLGGRQDIDPTRGRLDAGTPTSYSTPPIEQGGSTPRPSPAACRHHRVGAERRRPHRIAVSEDRATGTRARRGT